MRTPNVDATIAGHLPPHDLEAEAAVLSAVMLDPEAMGKIPELRAEHFYSEAHRRVFEASLALREAGKPVDVLQVNNWLKDRNRLRQIGGAGYLSEILAASPVVAHVASHARGIREKWHARQIIFAAQRIVAEGYESLGDVASYAATAAAAIAQATRREGTSLRSIGSMLDEGLRRADARRLGLEKPVNVPWRDLASQLGGGLWPGLHLLVGGTGSGKSTLALQTAVSAAKEGTPVCYVGLELGELDVTLRVLGEEARVSWSKLYTGRSSPQDVAKARAAAPALEGLPFYVAFGRPTGWPASELGVLAEEMRRAHPETTPGALPMLLVLDFLQIVGDEPQTRSEMRERIGRAAYVARDVARRLNVAVLAISSAARDKYAALAGDGLREAGLRIDDDGRRFVLSSDGLVGTGKESGDVEFAADSVTVSVRGPRLPSVNPDDRCVVLVTAKGRATGASWCALRFERGQRFTEWSESAREVVAALDEERAPRSTKNGAKAGPSTKFTEV